jgi:hypothetical protein
MKAFFVTVCHLILMGLQFAPTCRGRFTTVFACGVRREACSLFSIRAGISFSRCGN